MAKVRETEPRRPKNAAAKNMINNTLHLLAPYRRHLTWRPPGSAAAPAPPWEGLPACSSADVRTILERMQAVRHPDGGDGKGRDDDHHCDGPGPVPARLALGTATVPTPVTPVVGIDFVEPGQVTQPRVR